ncbi:hypothetical protein OG211_34810 [Streptomyces niveus]|uniref:hypothetical protein n=1 Tax=Streptomyces niveus TaxID=193462 RepID=UPI0038695EE8|nr:hypothetical protein OG211_34810 [Streptomyces niveus]
MPTTDEHRAREIRRIYGLLEGHPQQVMRGVLPALRWEAEGKSFDPGIPRRLHHLVGNEAKAGVGELEALRAAGIGMVKREGKDGYKIDKNTPTISNPLRPVQDGMRASEVRRIYGLLEGHPQQVAPGFLPAGEWKAEGESFDPGIPRRLHHLLGNRAKAGVEELEALRAAGIGMVKREGKDGYKIDKNTPTISNPLRPVQDGMRASEIRRIYGLLEGHRQQVTPGFLPFRKWTAEGESFDPGITRRLHQLMEGRYKAGVEEMEALQAAGIRMVKREGKDGYNIDKATPTISIPVPSVRDEMRASEIRRIYGLLEGHPAQVERGFLPHRKWTAEGESFDPGITNRLHNLMEEKHKVGVEELEALQAAGIGMVKREGKDGYNIDKATPTISNPLRPVQDGMRASEIRRIYGLLDGHPAQVKRGFLPGQAWKAVGESLDPGIPWRLHNLKGTRVKAGVEEMEALQAAGIKMVKREGKDGYKIDKSTPAGGEIRRGHSSQEVSAYAPLPGASGPSSATVAQYAQWNPQQRSPQPVASSSQQPTAGVARQGKKPRRSH